MTSAEDFLNFLAPDDIRVKGHRHGVEHILHEYIHKRKTAEEIADHFRTLSLAEIYAVLFYYHTHKEEMDRYVGDWLEFGFSARLEQAKDPRFQAMRDRLMKLRSAKTPTV